MSLRAYAFACALVSGAVQAQAPETLGWLRKIHDATQKLSYSGTFVYQNGSRSETSRITRYADAGGDIEKLEVMDGVPREIVREKDTVRCYLPGARLVKVDRRTERGFPALLPERITALAQQLRHHARREPAHRRLRLPGGGAHARKTTCATATASTPTRRAACCCAR